MQNENAKKFTYTAKKLQSQGANENLKKTCITYTIQHNTGVKDCRKYVRFSSARNLVSKQ